LPGLLLREPRLSDRDWVALGSEVRARHSTLWIGVHDRAHLAEQVGGDALHLGFRSLSPAQAREVVGAKLPIGLSTHATDQGQQRRAWAEADYLFHGPVRATPSKHGLCEPIGFDGFARAVAASDRPMVAIGGLQPEDAAAAIAAGAHGIAVLAGILGHEDTRAVVAATEGYVEACSALT
jgi:thiamine-phosphate pyrophosphorylase